MAIFDTLSKRIHGVVKRDEPLKPHTYMRIGGQADLLVIPENTEELRWVLSFARKQGLRYFIMGNGTNLIFDDRGYRGLVIKTGTCLNQVQVSGESIFAGSGVNLMDLILASANAGLSCLEQLAGIPGTVGGAIWMNAGAFGKEIQDCITDVHYLDREGNEKAGAVTFDYRESLFEKGDVILGAHFSFEKREKDEILTEIEEIQKKRAERQPLEFPSAGSVFKNPPDRFAGAIIDQLGMKGMRIGDAEISAKHANFIINRGNASCEDVRQLIHDVREHVLREEGIDLELEVEFVKANEEAETE
jgi:UDP-N-acetylmuramate dehydrogenase